VRFSNCRTMGLPLVFGIGTLRLAALLRNAPVMILARLTTAFPSLRQSAGESLSHVDSSRSHYIKFANRRSSGAEG
jgi:hypothetical protein